MTREEIIEMATKVYGECKWHESALQHLQIFAQLIAEKEREDCAKLCEALSNTEANMNKTWRNGCKSSAYTIRAKRQE
jgi:hypothetical protein